MKCATCGADLYQYENECHYCGEPSRPRPAATQAPRSHVYQHSYERPQHVYVEHHVSVSSSRNRLILLLLCIFFGGLGVHKFYEGKPGMGFLYLITHGLFGVGRILDIISIAIGSPTDGAGLPIEW